MSGKVRGNHNTRTGSKKVMFQYLTIKVAVVLAGLSQLQRLLNLLLKYKALTPKFKNIPSNNLWIAMLRISRVLEAGCTRHTSTLSRMASC